VDVRVDQPRQDGDLPERGGFGRMLRAAAHPDAREALRGGIRGVVEMYAAHRDVLRTGRDLSIEKTAATLITTADRSLCR
jgi:hypothetical protein